MGLRQFSFTKGAIYIAVQFLGSIFAALLILIIVPYKFQGEGVTSIEFPHLPKNMPTYQSFIMQFIGSGFYVWTYYALIVDSRAPSNIFGFAVAGVTAISDLAFGPMVGGCINPIKYIGPRLVTAKLNDPWVYLTAPILGGIFAGFYFDFFVLERKEKEELIDDDEEEPPKVEAKDDEADFGTLDNKVQENPMKKALFTQENSRRDNQMMDEESEEEGSQQGSDVQSKSSFYNI